MSSWLLALFRRRPRHIAWHPNPAYRLLTTSPFFRMPVCVGEVTGEWCGMAVSVRTTYVALSVN